MFANKIRTLVGNSGETDVLMFMFEYAYIEIGQCNIIIIIIIENSNR